MSISWRVIAYDKARLDVEFGHGGCKISRKRWNNRKAGFDVDAIAEEAKSCVDMIRAAMAEQDAADLVRAEERRINKEAGGGDNMGADDGYGVLRFSANVAATETQIVAMLKAAKKCRLEWEP